MRLTDKIALVTGASRGIGSAVALAFAREGADVVVHYRTKRSEAETVANSIRQMGRQSWMIQADLGIPDEIDAMFDRLEAEIDHLDILVNNAGMEFGKSFYRFSASEWDQILDVNLRGAFLCSSRAARMMMKRQSGTIINMSSIHDVVPRRYFTPYCVSKAGLLMLTRCTSLELSDYHIRVNAISPGAIRTDMNRKALDSLGESFRRQIPWKEVGDTSDVTGAAVFLASDESRYATGTTLYIDGGYSLNTIRNEGEYE